MGNATGSVHKYLHTFIIFVSLSPPRSPPLSLSIWVIGNKQEAIVGYLLVAPLCTSSQLFSWFVLFIFVRVFGVLFLFFFHIRMRIFTLFLIYVRPGIPGRHTRLPGQGVESSRVPYPVRAVLCHSSSPAGIYTFSGFHLACTFPRFSLFLFSPFCLRFYYY